MKLLCKIGLHRWRFVSPDMTGCGAFETCSRCGLRRYFAFAGAYIYERANIPPKAAKHMDAAFDQMGSAFREMDAAFDALRDKEAGSG